MKITYITLIILLCTASLYGQTVPDSINRKINQLSQEVSTLKSELQVVQKKNRELASKQKIVNDNINILTTKLLTDSTELSKQIEIVGTNLGELDDKATSNNIENKDRIATLDNSLSKNTLYWIIAVLAIALLSIMIYVILRKRIANEREELTIHINEEAIKIDSKLVEVLETQMHLMKEERTSAPPKEDEYDHTLALKVADEITRIHRNISRMDEGTKGLKQLAASVKRIQDNFEANGYELVEMLGKPYQEGTNASITFKSDENIDTGISLITKIIKPQINFKGKMIQAAQIEVSQGI